MLQSDFQESTKPLLRQDQIKESENEIKRLTGMLEGPDHIKKAIQDKPAVQQMLRNIQKDLETQRPQPYSTEELDSAIRREEELRQQWLQGMPTAAEMRKAPPGVLEKNIAWEKRNKAPIMEWKNIRRRLYESGDLKKLDVMDAYGVSNVEMYRPTGGPQEGNFHNALIPGQDFYMQQIPNSVVFSEEEITALKELNPDLANKLATMPAEARAGIKEVLACLPTNNTITTEIKHKCAHDGGCKREVSDEGELCWQHQPKLPSETQE